MVEPEIHLLWCIVERDSPSYLLLEYDTARLTISAIQSKAAYSDPSQALKPYNSRRLGASRLPLTQGKGAQGLAAQ